MKLYDIFPMFCLLWLTLIPNQEVMAQNYFTDFENVSKANYALDTVMIGSYRWAMKESVVTTSNSDIKNGLKSARFRHSIVDSVYMKMADDKPDGLGSISFYYARADFSGDRTGTAPLLGVYYSIDAGQSWVSIDTINFVGTDTLTYYVSDTVNITGAVRVKLQTMGSGSGKRINIDDLLITPYIIIEHISLLGKTPVGNDVSPATDSLTLTFDHMIAAGTGEISLYQSGQVVPQVIPVPSSSVTISDSMAIITGIQLQNASSYYVNMTAGTFTNSAGLMPNTAIIDTLSWAFATADTVVPPPPVPMTILNETFDHCNSGSSSLGVFHQYSSKGNRVWDCILSGREDSTGVSMLGGIATGISEVNRDWLISNAPFDFSAMPSPILSLWQRRSYDGQVSRDIRVSTNYTGSGDPELATWSVLEVQAMTAAPAYYWTPVTGILLDAFKHTPFYLAFTYANTTEGAYEVIYDDISVSNESITLTTSKKVSNIGFAICGIPDQSQINVCFEPRAASVLQAGIYDMTGRKAHHEEIRLPAGKSTYVIHTALSAGLYLLQVNDGFYSERLKVVVP